MIRQLQEIAFHAGSLFSDHRLSQIEEKEGHANFVTNIDREVEDYLQDALLKLIPGSRIIGEEKDNDLLSAEPTWIVDPVDGTTNLIHGYRPDLAALYPGALPGGKRKGSPSERITDSCFFLSFQQGADRFRNLPLLRGAVGKKSRHCAFFPPMLRRYPKVRISRRRSGQCCLRKS